MGNAGGDVGDVHGQQPGLGRCHQVQARFAVVRRGGFKRRLEGPAEGFGRLEAAFQGDVDDPPVGAYELPGSPIEPAAADIAAHRLAQHGGEHPRHVVIGVSHFPGHVAQVNIFIQMCFDVFDCPLKRCQMAQSAASLLH